MIVTIDGPAGAGKSSVSKQVADRLGFDFLDTGAMYRAVTWVAMERGLNLFDNAVIERLIESLDLAVEGSQVVVDGQDVSQHIRTPEVTAAIHHVANCTNARRQLSAMQRSFAKDRDLVSDGRDQGTEVFPDADCKVFLTASPEERARRRQVQLKAKGVHETLESILASQEKRDAEDRERPVGALRPAEDAFILYSDGMTPEQVIDQIVETVGQAKRSMNGSERKRNSLR